MNHELYKYMKNDMINDLYHKFWLNTLKQFKESNEETGLYFWLLKDNNKYIILHNGTNGLIKETIDMNETEKDIVMKKLNDDGFKISITKNNNTLLVIGKKEIINYVKNKKEKNETSKMPITPFSETRKRR